jgi:hypothetical protein
MLVAAALDPDGSIDLGAASYAQSRGRNSDRA